MGKAPAFQFYVGDWRRDTQVQMASMEVRGVWIEMLCCMWDSPERGKLTGTILSLSRMIGCEINILQNAILQIKNLEIGNVTCNGDVTNCNTKVTIINRRMYKEAQDRINTRVRVQKHRQIKPENKGSNKKVTPPSSTSSSTSISLQRKLIKEKAGEVIFYLNEKIGKKYTRTDEIEARLKDGGTIEQCKQIIDNKLQDKYFQENNFYYMKPTTLFRKSHWDDYLNDIREPEKQPAPEQPKPEHDYEAYRQKLLKAEPKLNERFKEEIINSTELKELNGWDIFIKPLIVAEYTKEDRTLYIFHENDKGVRDNYIEDIYRIVNKNKAEDEHIRIFIIKDDLI